MVSVCMATKNGSAYLREQIDSILIQLKATDELVISDDASCDDTIQIITSYGDPRIRLLKQETSKGVATNFEHALKACLGDYVFLADQDDVWNKSKISTMILSLKTHDLVICDCQITDDSLRLTQPSFFVNNGSRKGFIKNLFRNSYIGCCMAFRRTVLERALPFPKDIPIHDFWIGLTAELYFSIKFIPDALVYHRRHESNASTTGSLSRLSIFKRLDYRYRVVKGLILH